MVFHTKLTPFRCFVLILFNFGVIFLFVSGLLNDIADTPSHSRSKNPRDDVGPFPGDELRHIHWFVQVSDIHVSIFYDKKRAPDLTMFIKQYLMQMIKPEVVLVTGDLTDAKYPDKTGSAQFEQEWKMYGDVIHQTGILNHTVWLDIRGNHDVFSVPDNNSPENFYRKYSAQGRLHPSHYMYKHKTEDGNSVTFIAVDSCPQPGPRRPFNFFGNLNQDDLATLKQYREQAKGGNKTIWFGHYPSSTVHAPDPGFRSILGNGGLYLCGHLHSMLEYVPRMHAHMQQDYLELEVGDWKDYRRFRVFAIDHDLFSFTDQVFGQLPIILVTNPKNAYFNQPIEEPTGRMRHSTHIRILVFSPGAVQSVSVSIDGVHLGDAQHSNGPLYVLPWKPATYLHGVHHITVTAKDSVGNVRMVKEPFSLDNTKLAFDVMPRYLLMFDHIFFVRCLFAVGVLMTSLPLVLLRFLSIQLETSYSGQSCQGCLSRFIQTWIRRFYLLSHTDRLFYSLLFYVLYICLGPWFIGEIMEGHVGAMFVYGIYVYGQYIPGTLTYMYGFTQLVLFNIPMTLYLAWLVDDTLSQHKHPSAPESLSQSRTQSNLIYRATRWLVRHGIFVVLLLWQLNLAYYGFYKAYGLMSFILCPVRTWSVPLALYLRMVAMRQCIATQNGEHERVHVEYELDGEPIRAHSC